MLRFGDKVRKENPISVVCAGFGVVGSIYISLTFSIVDFCLIVVIVDTFKSEVAVVEKDLLRSRSSLSALGTASILFILGSSAHVDLLCFETTFDRDADSTISDFGNLAVLVGALGDKVEPIFSYAPVRNFTTSPNFLLQSFFGIAVSESTTR